MIPLHDVPDPGFSSDELATALETVKRRVHRRRGGTVLPVLVAITVGAGAYFTVLQPVTGDHVVVGVPGTETAASDVSTSESDGIAETDVDAAATASEFVPDATADFAAQVGDAAAASASGAGDAAPIVTTTATPPGSGDVLSTDGNRPNPPAISFDTSNVITRESDASASTSTPPMSDADTGNALGDSSVGRSDGSDDEVGESSPADGLEGPHTATPESSTTSNPSAGSDDSGDGANPLLPPISFEDTGAAPIELSATTSAEVATAAAVPSVVAWDQQVVGRTVSLSLTINSSDGSAAPCGVFADFGDGEVQSIPCGDGCEVPEASAGAARVAFEHTYAAPGQAFVIVGATDSACLADPGLQFSIPLG